MIGKILIVSDEDGIEFINKSKPEWHKHGFEVVSLDFETVLKANSLEPYFLIAFAVGHHNNILFQEYAMYIRSISNIPIIFYLCDKFKPDEEIRLINTGADQVIDLPIDTELAVEKSIATIRRNSMIRKDKKTPTTLYIIDDITLDVGRYVVIVDNKEIQLLNKECNILKLLMVEHDHIVTYDQIFCKVWGYEYVGSNRSIIHNQIKNLRLKLKWHNRLPEYIVTAKNIGYSFKSHKAK